MPTEVQPCPERLVKVQVRYEAHDYSIFRMKSPTGRIKSVYCNGRWNKFSDELGYLIQRLDTAQPGEYRWGSWKTVVVSARMMQEVKNLDQEGRARAARRRGK